MLKGPPLPAKQQFIVSRDQAPPSRTSVNHPSKLSIRSEWTERDCERCLSDSPSFFLSVSSRSRCCKRIPRKLVANALIMRWHLNASNPWSNAGGSRDRFSRPDVNLRRRLLENTPPAGFEPIESRALLKNLRFPMESRYIMYPWVERLFSFLSVRKKNIEYWLKLWD